MIETTAILGLDIGINRTGWCVGDGASVPVAGAWRFPKVDDDIGALLVVLNKELHALAAAHPFARIVYESPIVLQRDRLIVIRKTYAMGGFIEYFGKRKGVLVTEASAKALKKELAGFNGAEKADMVYAAEKIGVTLPVTDAAGRMDAADAVAAWLLGVRLYARQYQARWDRALYTSRGALL